MGSPGPMLVNRSPNPDCSRKFIYFERKISVRIELAESSWTESIAKREAARDVMRNGERVGEAFAILFFYLVILFFVVNQVDDTGFFTTGFGSTEMVLFYGGLIFGMIAPILRLILGRRNKVRPVELISNGFFVIAASYLLSVFPFDFAHFQSLSVDDRTFSFELRPVSLSSFSAMSCGIYEL